MRVNHGTLSGNSPPNDAGGSYNFGPSATLAISHTLRTRGANRPNFINATGGSVTHEGFNLADDSSADAFATQVPNPPLGSRANHGGPTRTHALLPGSPAIAAGAGNLPNAWQIADVLSASGSGVLSYTNTVTAVQRTAATNSGWHYTVVSPLLAGSEGDGPAHFMIYGNGVRCHGAGWDINASGQLAATLDAGVSPFVTHLTTAGAAATNYHRHELSYHPVSGQGQYRFDGPLIRTWPGEVLNAQNGQVWWGANSSLGMGRMNYHQVKFAVSGLGTVAEYLAGFQGSPATAPKPANQGWGVALPATVGAATNAPVSPDALALQPGLPYVLGLDFDQRGPGYLRPVGSAVDLGAFEFQAASAAVSFTGLQRTTSGVRLQLQGAPHDELSLQWNNQSGPGGWKPLTSGATDGAGRLDYLDTSAAGQAKRFYRAVRPCSVLPRSSAEQAAG